MIMAKRTNLQFWVSFWQRVDRRNPKECWEWLGYIDPQGYAPVWRNGRFEGAHRIITRLFYGVILKNYESDHLCRNRACVNPLHLEIVTKKINILRGIGCCAINLKKILCPRGHPLEEENLYIDSALRRRCLQCYREIRSANQCQRRAIKKQNITNLARGPL